MYIAATLGADNAVRRDRAICHFPNVRITGTRSRPVAEMFTVFRLAIQTVHRAAAQLHHQLLGAMSAARGSDELIAQGQVVVR